jgi:hypothetical protein
LASGTREEDDEVVGFLGEELHPPTDATTRMSATASARLTGQQVTLNDASGNSMTES